MQETSLQLSRLAADYFQYMSSAYPIMTSSDEFYFFPRANETLQYINFLDNLDKDKIRQDIKQIERFKTNLNQFMKKGVDLETEIDRQMLKGSISAFLREFQLLKVWQSNPNLYLKIIIIGIDSIVNKFPLVHEPLKEALIKRIKKIPTILNQAIVNLNQISPLYQERALKLAQAEIKYFLTGLPLSLKKKGVSLKGFDYTVKKTVESLENFKDFLKRTSAAQNLRKDKEQLSDLLKNTFSYKRNLKEIFEIASCELRNTKIELKKVANGFQNTNNWQNILAKYRLKIKDKKSLLNLYSMQIQQLKEFLLNRDLISIPEDQAIKIQQTPYYLEPIRASASYSCPLTKSQKESAFFYVSIANLKEIVHQEYIFVVAHEIYPGHHLLDSIRRNIKNQIRKQIESPLFYEGWASYSERLIDQFGFIKNPIQKLVGLRRQAWRAIRAKLDVGLRINKIKLSDAERELRDIGYSHSRVKSMLKHYLLTNGYQLCYTIGKFEIESLRKKFADHIGLKKFHNYLLSAGEIPFYLVKKRMEKLCRKNS